MRLVWRRLKLHDLLLAYYISLGPVVFGPSLARIILMYLFLELLLDRIELSWLYLLKFRIDLLLVGLGPHPVAWRVRCELRSIVLLMDSCGLWVIVLDAPVRF